MSENTLLYSLTNLLSPVTSAGFITNYWEKKVLVINRNNPDYWRELLTLKDIDNVISVGNARPGELSIVKSGDEFRPSPFNPVNDEVDTISVYKYFDDGYTVILNRANRYIESLKLLCNTIGKEMGMPFQTNLYLTPSNAKGFGPHYDSHCVFVLQISGTKKWKIYDRPIINPTNSKTFEASQLTNSDFTQEFTLQQGDIAYIPRGFIHDAVSQSDSSLHITLGALALTWSDLLLDCVKLLSDSEALFRKGILLDFNNDEAMIKDANKITSLLSRKLKSKHILQSVLTTFKEKVISDRKPILKDQLEQLKRLHHINSYTQIYLRPSILFEYIEAEGFMKIKYQGYCFTFPINFKESIIYILTNNKYLVQDIPGDTDFIVKKMILKKFVRVGLISIELNNQ